MLKVASGTVFVAEATTCTLMAEDGVVTNLEGLPSKPVEFGSYMFQMKDSVPPAILGFLPSAGAGSVHLAFSDTQTVSLLWGWSHVVLRTVEDTLLRAIASKHLDCRKRQKTA